MERRLIATWILILCTTVPPCHGYLYSHSEPYVPVREKVTKLHFFFHDTLSGSHPSAVLVARPGFPTPFNETQVAFGCLYATDDPVTVGPELTSGVIGNARGIWVSTGRDVISLVVYWDIGFTDGEFKGSTISIFSRNPIMEPERELAVVGGTGKFRMARGFAKFKGYFSDSSSGDAIVEGDVTLIHNDDDIYTY